MSKRNEYLNKQEKECLYKQFKEIHDKIDFQNSCFTFMETKYNYAGYLHSAILSVGDFRYWENGDIDESYKQHIVVYVLLTNKNGKISMDTSNEFNYGFSGNVTTVFIETDFRKELYTMNYIADLMFDYVTRRYHL